MSIKVWCGCVGDLYCRLCCPTCKNPKQHYEQGWWVLESFGKKCKAHRCRHGGYSALSVSPSRIKTRCSCKRISSKEPQPIHRGPFTWLSLFVARVFPARDAGFILKVSGIYGGLMIIVLSLFITGR